MGCSASSLLPINKAINPPETVSEGEKKSPTNGVNGSNTENTVQSNGVTKVPPSIPEETVKEGEEKESSETSPDNDTTKSEKPDEEVSEEVIVSSSTGVEDPSVVVVEEKVNENEQKEGNETAIDELLDAKHEIPNDIEPNVSTTETPTIITIEEITKSPTEIEEKPSEPIQEEEPQGEIEEPVIPIISDDVPLIDPLAAEQSLKLPDEGKLSLLL